MPARLLASLVLLCALLGLVPAISAQGDELVLEGELTEDESEVSFEFTLEAGQIVTVSTEAAEDMDTILTLNDPDGEEVARNDDEADGITTSRLIYVAEDSGIFTAVVTGYDEDDLGDFTLRIRFGADFGLSEAAEPLIEQQVTLDATDSSVEIPVDLEAGQIVVISTLALTADLDTLVRLEAEDGTRLAENDDRGDGSLNSQLIFEVLESGPYVVTVTSYDGTGIGDLLLSVALDPQAEPPFNFASIEGTRIAEYSGTLDDDQTSVEYTVELNAGQTLLAVGDATSGDLDTVLSMNDPEGFPVASNDDRGDGTLNSAFAYTAPAAGVYTVVIERFPRSDSSGDFQLVLSSVDAWVVGVLLELLDTTVTLSGPVEIIETANYRLHYTLEGRDATTPEYAQEVADTLEEIYDVQVNQMGWREPVRDDTGLYPAYIADTISDGGALGYAKTVVVTFDNPNSTDIREEQAARAVFVIDNDFADLDKEASASSLMRATITHEFNHIIQFGYDHQEGLAWMFESTASWIETVTVGNDQDATDYVTSDFEVPELCFTTNEQDGYLAYGQWTFLQSLADQYGESVVVRLWENSVPYDGWETLTQTLDSVGTTLPAAIERWRVQNFARAYDLAPFFERTVWLENTITETGAWTFTGAGIQELGANYYALDLSGPHGFSLDGEESLQLVALGVTGDTVEAIPLGSKGIFDGSAYDYAALMVFNTAVPKEPGDCSFTDYEIRVVETSGEVPAAAYTFSAEHFEPLQ
ncbi:MAG TPA: DUF6055 domain-containing protein [Aggregatilineales bacterium]|nr:DUF6055 domain-containing protein [Aggregatilineales bacterium]